MSTSPLQPRRHPPRQAYYWIVRGIKRWMSLHGTPSIVSILAMGCVTLPIFLILHMEPPVGSPLINAGVILLAYLAGEINLLGHTANMAGAGWLDTEPPQGLWRRMRSATQQTEGAGGGSLVRTAIWHQLNSHGWSILIFCLVSVLFLDAQYSTATTAATTTVYTAGFGCCIFFLVSSIGLVFGINGGIPLAIAIRFGLHWTQAINLVMQALRLNMGAIYNVAFATFLFDIFLALLSPSRGVTAICLFLTVVGGGTLGIQACIATEMLRDIFPFPGVVVYSGSEATSESERGSVPATDHAS